METKFKIFGLALLILAVPAMADFVSTTLVLSFDSVISFQVFTLGNSGTNFTNSMTTSPGNFTEAYFFNSSNPTASLVVPCSNADSTSCQSGMGRPAYRYRSTGNINTTVWLKLNSDPTSITLGGNSSKPTGCTAGTDYTFVAGNINSTSWAQFASQIGTNAPCYEVNITMYANYNTPPAGMQVKTLKGYPRH